MTSILPDSSAWIDHLRGRKTPQTTLLRQAIENEDVLIGDLIALEILQGTRDDVSFARTRRLLEPFAEITLCGPEIAVKAAENYRRLRSRGVTVRGTIDVVIATWCIENGAAIIHNDRDMAAMERELGLRAYG